MFSKFGYILIGCALLLLGGSLFLKESLEQKNPSLGSGGSVSTNEVQKETLSSDQNKNSLVILFGGDMMFDRYIRTVMKKRGNSFPLESLRSVLSQADLVVANLEGPVTENTSLSETSVIGARDNYFFTFDPIVATVLRDFHIGVVNIGNNHILNFKEEGVKQTEKFLEEAGVGYFGSPLSSDDRLVIKEIKGVRVALVNYNQFVWQGKEKALADIETAQRSAEVVVLYAHWGTEYVAVLPKTKALAREFIDAGVDLIIGSHPHVVQEKEVYQGKTIYYSLGNMVFDQYFSQDTMTGLLVRAVFDPVSQTFAFEEIPILLKNTGETVLVPQGE